MGNENFFRQNVGLENCRGGGEASHSDPEKKKKTRLSLGFQTPNMRRYELDPKEIPSKHRLTGKTRV